MHIFGRWARSASLAFVASGALALGLMPTQAANAAPDPGASSAAAAQQARAQAKAEAHYTHAGCGSPQDAGFARCFSMVRTNLAHQIVADPDQPPPAALGPADIQDAYNLPGSGNGQVVGIVDAFGDSHAEDDLAQFRSYYGLPPCTTENGCFTKVNQDGEEGPYPPDNAGWGLETSLDLDAVSAACPNCHILLVQGDDNSLANLGISVDTAAELGAKFVSNSYGVAGETPNQTEFDHYYDHPGVAVTVSTGDIGGVQSWPATNPHVTGVGGTTLTQDDSERGWTETAWAAGGSGCSLYEEKPDYQEGIDTNCDMRANADISADADPNTGLAVYDTLGYGGWLQVGGTSLSSPLVASMYALAGTPVEGTYPVTYPYDDSAKATDLFDVTEGSNGGCGNVLCNAGAGWDGPTGWGTPNGVQALTTGPHGDIAGTVTDAGTGEPIGGATVTTDQGESTNTDADGSYDLTVPVGTYDVTATAFGYDAQTQTGVTVEEDQTVTADFALTAQPSVNLHGVVTDGSGHGWPMYAKITIDGYPGGAVWTDPFTGYYSVDLPANATYTMHVSAQYPGYVTQDVQVDLGSSGQAQNVQLTVDQSTCVAPGYHYAYDGSVEQFTGWSDQTTQDDWTNVDNNGSGLVWDFDNPGDRTPPPGGDDDFAVMDAYYNYINGLGYYDDTSLVSPAVDLSDQTTPEIGFDTYYNEYFYSVGDVDLSLDAGATWENVWHQTTTSVTGHVDIPIPQAAGQSNVQVRFHYSTQFLYWWAIDNVFVGNRTCVTSHGGLVAGLVDDDNTGDAVNGAKVTSDDNPDESTSSMATPDDPNLSDGFYWMFSSLTGSHSFTASKSHYVDDTESVDVATSYITRQDFTLRAGHLLIGPTSISKTERMGGLPKSKVVRFGNDGTVPVHVKLSEQNGGFTPMKGYRGRGAPKTLIHGQFSPESAVLHGRTDGAKDTTPYAPPWTDIADTPAPVMDNAVAYGDGKVYSIAGITSGNQFLASGYVYDSDAQAWSQIADAPQALEAPMGAYVGGKVYLIGGWNAAGNAVSDVYAYDPGADSWTQVASLPKALTAPGVAVLNGQIYVVAGCTTGGCVPNSSSVYRYDPGGDSWTQLADYPVALSWQACAGIAGEVACGGGIDDSNQSTTATYVYDPGSDTWTQGADMPYDNWAMAYSGANNMLQVAGGVTNGTATITNQAAQYDPSGNSWSALSNANHAEYRGRGACGMYKIGGSTGGFAPQSFAEVLPGYDQCGGGADVSWLSENKTEFDVAPGHIVKVRVTLDNSTIDQPGTYTAKVAVATDTPYSTQPVDVTLHLNPPRSWGKVSGTVTDMDSGAPITAAVVRVNTFGGSGAVGFTLKTDKNGYYQLWLDSRYNPLQLIFAKDGYIPKVKGVRIHRGENTTVNMTLTKF